MSGLADLAVSTISQSQRRVEIAAQNIANATTPAYKRRVPFATLVKTEGPGEIGTSNVNAAIDFRSGKLTPTGNPYDIALATPGYLAMRNDSRVVYTRQGQLSVDRDGRLVNEQGFALQMADGRDMVVGSNKFVIADDGTVNEDGKTLGKIAMFMPSDEHGLEPVSGGFVAGAADMVPKADARVQQGFIETSNVTMGDEMVGMMEALRRAEAGQRVMNVYDDLMGRVITSFGDSVR